MFSKTSSYIFALLIIGQALPASADTLTGLYLDATRNIRKVTYAGALGRWRLRRHDQQHVNKNFNRAYKEPKKAAKAGEGVPMDRNLRPRFLGVRQDIYHSMLAKNVVQIRSVALNDTIFWIKRISTLESGDANIKALQAYLPQLEALARETVKTTATKKGMKAVLKSSLDLPRSLARAWGSPPRPLHSGSLNSSIAGRSAATPPLWARISSPGPPPSPVKLSQNRRRPSPGSVILHGRHHPWSPRSP